MKLVLVLVLVTRIHFSKSHKFKNLPRIENSSDLTKFVLRVFGRFSLSPEPWMQSTPGDAGRCLDGESIYKILHLDVDKELHHYSDNDTLQQTCTVMLHHLLHLPESCIAKNVEELETKSYNYFAESIMNFNRTKEKEGTFSKAQLAAVMTKLKSHMLPKANVDDDHHDDHENHVHEDHELNHDDHDEDDHEKDDHEKDDHNEEDHDDDHDNGHEDGHDDDHDDHTGESHQDLKCMKVTEVWESTDDVILPLEVTHLVTKLILNFSRDFEMGCSADDSVPNPTQFVSNLFKEFSRGSELDKTAVVKILQSLRAGKESHEKGEEEKEGNHDGHDHDAHDHKRRRRAVAHDHEDDHHDHEPDLECYTAEKLLTLHGIGAKITMGQFYSLCPALVQQSVSNSCVTVEPVTPIATTPTNTSGAAGVTVTQSYGYGFLAVTIITLVALAGLLLIPCINKSMYDRLISTLICLAIGTMVGDALLHLVPFCLGLHSHDDHDHGEDEAKPAVWKMFIMFLAIYGFYVLESFFSFLSNVWNPGGKDEPHGHSHHFVPEQQSSCNEKAATSFDSTPHPTNLASHFTVNETVTSLRNESPPRTLSQSQQPQHPQHPPPNPPSRHDNTCLDTGDEVSDPSNIELTSRDNHIRDNHIRDTRCDNPVTRQDVDSMIEAEGWRIQATTSTTSLQLSSRTASSVEGLDTVADQPAKKPAVVCGMPSVVMLILLGDGIHNFIDGIAIGAAFRASDKGSLTVGLATSVAVFLHELPHEFGDFAIFIASGLSYQKALLLNLLSGLTAYVGLFIGLSVAADESIRQWIMAITAGMFLYISLVNMLPEVMHNKESKNIVGFLLQNLGIWVGVIIMLLVALYEDRIFSH